MTPGHNALAPSLHESNIRLAACLNQLRSGPSHPLACRRPATPKEIEQILSELIRAGECLRSLPEHKDGELERELAIYQSNVTRLRDMLPSIHEALLRERARLEKERSRIGSAAEWARASQETL